MYMLRLCTWHLTVCKTVLVLRMYISISPVSSNRLYLYTSKYMLLHGTHKLFVINTILFFGGEPADKYWHLAG